MKINIITLHRAQNYGSVLQTFALQQKFKELGHEPIIMDYYPERYTNKGLLKRLKNKSQKFKNPVLLFIAKILIYPSYIRKNIIFNSFIKHYINLSKEQFSNNNEARKINWEADIFCTGSDQVWNSYWNEGVEKSLFLDFVPKGKMVFSYAASIGLSKISSEEMEEIRNLLEKYEFLSIREESGTNIIKQLGRNDVVQTLDPTLLLEKEEWSSYFDDKYKYKEYILTYNLHHDTRIDKYAKELKKKYNIPIINISYNWHDFIRNGRLCWCPSVGKFINLIKHAKFVIADSFHATVFSIIFERQFVCISPDVASSRMNSILKLLGLEKQLLNSKKNDIKIIETPIDYIKVKQILKVEKEKSINFLRKVTSIREFTHNK